MDLKDLKVISNGVDIPDECKCTWCGGKMERKGAINLGSGVNSFTLFCTQCGALVHHAHNSEHKITGFSIRYDLDE